TQLPPALDAMLDGRSDEVIPAEQLGRRPHLAEQDQAANSGAADRGPTAGHRGGDLNGKSVPGAEPAQERGIATPALSEPEVLTHDDPTELDAAQQPLQDGRRAQRGDLWGERDHQQVVEAQLTEQPGLFIEGGEVRRAMVRVEHAARVWLEGDQDAGGAGCAGAGDQRLQQGEVAPMDAVKAADGGVAGAEGPRRWKAEADRGHHAKTARGWIRRVASASPQASRSPSGPSNR